MKAVKIGDEFIEPDYRLMNSVCKYSDDTLFRKRCSFYQTTWCSKCRHNLHLQRYDEEMKKDTHNYYECIGGI